MKDKFSLYIPENELEKFAEWAFGPFYREFDEAMNFMESWNFKHSDKLKLELTGNISVDVPKMVQVWRDRQ